MGADDGDEPLEGDSGLLSVTVTASPLNLRVTPDAQIKAARAMFMTRAACLRPRQSNPEDRFATDPVVVVQNVVLPMSVDHPELIEPGTTPDIVYAVSAVQEVIAILAK